jgi:D-psicose/D-tagatose/L-ribulose 3-epimerase
MGYDGIEIPLGGGDRKHYQELQKIIHNEGLECTCTINGDIEHNMLSPDPHVYRKGLDHTLWGLEMAETLGSSILGGPFYFAPSVFTGPGPTAEEAHRASQGVLEVLNSKGTSEILLCAEILNHFECYFMNTVEQSLNWVEMVNHPSLGIHYETHHAHYEESDLLEAIRIGGDKIYHVHFSENHRGVLGSGLVNWQENIKALKEIDYDGWIVIEAFSTKNETLRKALHLWRELFKDEGQLAYDSLLFMRQSWCN